MSSASNLPDNLVISRAENDLLFGEDGRSYIDLFCGAGTALLGHVHPEVTAALHRQLDRTWNTGILPTPIRQEAVRLLDDCVPPSHGVVAFYSTGMEAVEFALRLARGVTGRRRCIGFNRCMHGKSMATAGLAWPSDAVTLPDIDSVSYVPRRSESEILEDLARRLADETVAAVVIEPFQGSGGGHLASLAFFQELAALCTARGTLLIVDEIFTGFHRTGALFLHHTLGIEPDVLLVGKAMGNGFPVSAVVSRRRYQVTASMLPGSTYAGNALAMSVVCATLTTMRRLPMAAMVARIGDTISTTLAPVVDSGIVLRGAGALWILEFAESTRAWDVAVGAARAGVVVSVTGPYIRLLPPATVALERLTRACGVIRDACEVAQDEPAREGDRRS